MKNGLSEHRLESDLGRQNVSFALTKTTKPRDLLPCGFWRLFIRVFQGRLAFPDLYKAQDQILPACLPFPLHPP